MALGDVEYEVRKIVEPSGEIHWTDLYVPHTEGYRRMWNTGYPVLNQEQIDEAAEFIKTRNLTSYVDRWSEYPKETDRVLPFRAFPSIELNRRCEVVARIQIAKRLGHSEATHG
jgi:hypothetical protein